MSQTTWKDFNQGDLVFKTPEFINSLINSTKEDLLYGMPTASYVVDPTYVNNFTNEFNSAYDKYQANKQLWNNKPAADYSPGSAQWLEQWVASNPDFYNPDGIPEFQNASFKSNPILEQSPGTVSLQNMYNTVKKDDYSPDVGDYTEYLDYSGFKKNTDNEKTDFAWGKFNTSVVKSMIQMLYPGEDDAVDQAAANAFLNKGYGKDNDYPAYGVYDSASKIVSSISTELGKLGYTPASIDQIKAAQNQVAPKYSTLKAQAIQAHKISDEENDRDVGGQLVLAAIAAIVTAGAALALSPAAMSNSVAAMGFESIIPGFDAAALTSTQLASAAASSGIDIAKIAADSGSTLLDGVDIAKLTTDVGSKAVDFSELGFGNLFDTGNYTDLLKSAGDAITQSYGGGNVLSGGLPLDASNFMEALTSAEALNDPAVFQSLWDAAKSAGIVGSTSMDIVKELIKQAKNLLPNGTSKDLAGLVGQLIGNNALDKSVGSDVKKWMDKIESSSAFSKKELEGLADSAIKKFDNSYVDDNLASLMGQYESAMGAIPGITDNFNATMGKQDALLDKFNSLGSKYDSLMGGFNAAMGKHDSLFNEYGNLQAQAQGQSDVYDELLSDFKARGGAADEFEAYITDAYKNPQNNAFISSLMDLASTKAMRASGKQGTLGSGSMETDQYNAMMAGAMPFLNQGTNHLGQLYQGQGVAGQGLGAHVGRMNSHTGLINANVGAQNAATQQAGAYGQMYGNVTNEGNAITGMSNAVNNQAGTYLDQIKTTLAQAGVPINMINSLTQADTANWNSAYQQGTLANSTQNALANYISNVAAPASIMTNPTGLGLQTLYGNQGKTNAQNSSNQGTSIGTKAIDAGVNYGLNKLFGWLG